MSGFVRNRSSIPVGRERELRAVEDALAAAARGRGGAVFLVGESGIGKSGLTAAAVDRAFAADMVLLRGRGSSIGPMVPFRSLTETLMSLSRANEELLVDVAALGPYRPVLARLIPDWGAPAAVEECSLVIMAEAVLRLVALAGRGRGCLVALEDLQDADAESLAVFEYLVDNLDQQPALLLGTVRNEPCAALDIARSAVRRGTASLVELSRLTRTDLRGLAGACLGVLAKDVPDPAVDLLWAGSAGNPFLAEELLAGIVDGGLLVGGDAGWHMAEGHADVPAMFARTVARRVEELTPAAHELLSAAAVAGRRFSFAVVRAVTGLPDRELLTHLHSEVGAQLVMPDEQLPDWYAFGHQLVREALLALLTPADRAGLSGRVADAIEQVRPGLPGEWCQAAAALRLAAGEPVAAGRLFTEAGRRALTQGAANSAVELLDRAWELLATGGAAERADALEQLLYALAEAGLGERALASVGLLDEVGELGRHRRAQLHTRLAWAAQLAGRGVHGIAQIEKARALLGPDATEAETAPIDAVEAHLVLDLPGQRQADRAERLARRAATVAEAVPLPVVACQAWQLLAALVRSRDPDEATACLQRARATAVRHDLPIWEIHTLVRQGNDDALREGSLDRLEQARSRAAQAGAVIAQCQAEQSIALYRILGCDFASAEVLVDRVFATTSRLKLLENTQYVLLVRAILAAHRGRRREMDEALWQFRRWEGDAQPQYASRVHGLARAFCALLEENRALAVEELAHALRAEETTPTVLQLGGRHGLHLLLSALSGAPAPGELAALPPTRPRWDRMFALYATAVLAGRAGAAEEASATVAEALAAGAPYAMGRHLGLRLASEAALTDGWGSPAEWLRLAEDHFHETDVPAVASACRALLRGSGVRVAQRRTGLSEIPAQLRSAGLTVREYEVLRLLADRLGNREIADRLHLSSRTVEKYVSNLISKTGLPNRFALSEYAVTCQG